MVKIVSAVCVITFVTVVLVCGVLIIKRVIDENR